MDVFWTETFWLARVAAEAAVWFLTTWLLRRVMARVALFALQRQSVQPRLSAPAGVRRLPRLIHGVPLFVKGPWKGRPRGEQRPAE